MNLIDLAPRDGAARAFGRSHLLLAAGLALVVALGGVGLGVFSDPDHAADLSAVRQWWSSALSGLSVTVVAVLLGISVVHHVGAALSVRAAAGVPLPRLELLGAQYAAAAVNRVVPAGIGAATVNGRFLMRRGGLAAAGAAAAVSAMAVLGAFADVLAFAMLIGLDWAFGSPGAVGELPLLAGRLTSVVPVSGGNWVWVVAVLLASGAGVACSPRVRRSDRMRRLRASSAEFGETLVLLARRPARLSGLLAASASTTLMLSAGFAASAILTSHGLAWRDFTALMIGYMVASAAGNAVPVPGGVGAVDAAYVGVLVAAGMPATNAIAAVLAFRLMTFWLPAAAGVTMLHMLRRRRAL